MKDILKAKKRGFTLLMAIVTTSLLLVISFMVVNIAVKQLVISSTNQQSQYSFYNADSGIDCAVYWDLKNSSQSPFATSTGGTISCNGQTFTTGSPAGTIIGGGGSANATSTFTINFTKGCVVVNVGKQPNGDTTIFSRGYNDCSSASLRFERGETLVFQGGRVIGSPPVTWTLTANDTGTGTGVVSGNGLSCNPTCTSNLPDGTSVSLTATPNSGSTFGGWSGACSGIGLCNLTMNANKSVTATFSSTAGVIGTGGCITSGGGFTIHTFNTTNCTGTFNPGPNVTSVQYLIVAGGGAGGGGGGSLGGGGGGGGVLSGSDTVTPNQNYPIVVGSGGTAGSVPGSGNNGGNSSFNGHVSIGGGGGGGDGLSGSSGGSGGGGNYNPSLFGGSGTAGQGNAGGQGYGGFPQFGGGGGGAGAAGIQDPTGAAGFPSSISGSSQTYAGGGGGGSVSSSDSGGAGGGGAGANRAGSDASSPGTPNTGGGGGGADFGSPSAGGSGIVIIRYVTPS